MVAIINAPPDSSGYSWQPFCKLCWNALANPYFTELLPPIEVWEQCAGCGNLTQSGVYAKAPASQVPYPKTHEVKEVPDDIGTAPVPSPVDDPIGQFLEQQRLLMEMSAKTTAWLGRSSPKYRLRHGIDKDAKR